MRPTPAMLFITLCRRRVGQCQASECVGVVLRRSVSPVMRRVGRRSRPSAAVFTVAVRQGAFGFLHLMIYPEMEWYFGHWVILDEAWYSPHFGVLLLYVFDFAADGTASWTTHKI